MNSEMMTDSLDYVIEKLEEGDPLTLTMVGQVFGEDFYRLLVTILMKPSVAVAAMNLALEQLPEAERDEIVEDIEDSNPTNAPEIYN